MASPRRLYELNVYLVADYFKKLQNNIYELPDDVLFDLYYQLYINRNLSILRQDLSNPHILSRMLKVTNRRIHLLKCFQALSDEGTIEAELAHKYNQCVDTPEKLIDMGLRIGGFLNDAGKFLESKLILTTCELLCIANPETEENWCRTLECCRKLLHAEVSYCNFTAAAITFRLAQKTIEKLSNVRHPPNLAAIYAEFSAACFNRNEFEQAYKWSIAALKQLNPSLPKHIIVKVLCQTAKSCVIKREFKKAGFLIKQAVYLAREIYDPDHPKYSDVLCDYGFFLLNSDRPANSVSIYRLAYKIRKAIFDKYNLNLALVHEDLAYALYVQEYSSGKFEVADHHVEQAIEIMVKILPANNLLLASAQRVKALILEEIALETSPTRETHQNLLSKSESLHLSALHLSKTAFGEKNVQTAKHYGNLGRLYQSMRRFQEAEEMHLKAIQIKKELLGPDDYEVGLSTGHLASLYNFQMNRYSAAEKLYKQSIEIGIKLFGETYSGLEYDYKGLMHLYTKLGFNEQYLLYMTALDNWKELKKKHAELQELPIEQKCPQPIERVITTFFSM